MNNLSHEGQNRRPDADATVVDSCSKSPVVDVEGGCSCALTHRLPTSAVHHQQPCFEGPTAEATVAKQISELSGPRLRYRDQ